MAFCTQCGEKFGDEHKFCSSCGAPAGEKPQAEEAKPESSSQKKEPEMVSIGSTSPDATVVTAKQLGLGCLGLVVVFGLIVLVAYNGFGGGSSDSSSSNSQSVEAPAPAPAPVEVETWDNDISRDDCAVIVAQTDYLKFLYSGDSFTGTSGDLRSASDVFTQIAGSYTGSDRDWLLKMAELSDEVAQGSDARAKPLKANLGLADQFCG